MDSFELLPSLAQGELAETSAPELVAAVFRSRASGTLWMETEESTEIRCFFRAGDMCGTGPFKGFQTLAHVLLTNDWVAALDIESSREEAAGKGKRHGEVLVSRGLLTHDQLRTALGAQYTANLTTLLGLTTGRYDWRGWEPPPAWAREVVVDPISAVIEALEQEQHEPRRRRVLEWMGGNAVRLSLDWPELQQRVTLNALDRRAAALLALPRRFEEFVQASRLPQTRAEALLVALLLAGGIELQPQAELTTIEPEPIQLEPEQPEAEPLLEPLPEPRLDTEVLAEPLEEPQLHPAPVRRSPPADPFAEPRLEPPRPREDLVPDDELIPELRTGAPLRRSSSPPRRASVAEDEALARLDSLSLEDMTAAPPPLETLEEPLEIDHRPRRGASAGGGTAGQAREEPIFDNALQPEGGRSDEGRSAELRKKMLARGLRNLGTAPQSQDDLLEPMPAKQAAPFDAQLSGDDQRFLDEVRARSQRMPSQNAYARLGVSPKATSEQIKAAYLTAAKRYHPDRSSAPGLVGLQPELQTLFALLKEAFDAISTAELRASYDAQLKAGGKPATRKDEAVLNLKMGEALLKKRDFEGALLKLRRSVELDPTGDALAALAWTLVADTKGSPQAKKEAAGLINRALQAPGVTARTYYVAGVLWRTKDPESAVDAFRKALEIDPQHSDAALELRLIEQRRGKQPKTGGGVLSGLLFGKRKS